ncbi:MAG: FAD:protein FMN transferase [Magnetococcales bacterium]|nr:FAD:protein FMN transferase [Magnetococcales bacterium]
MKRFPGMTKQRIFSLFFLLILLYIAFFTGENRQQPDKRTTTRLLMGTLVSITTWGVEESREREGVKAAFAEMARIEGIMSRHQPQTAVARFNAGLPHQPQPIPVELAQLIEKAQHIQTISDGSFNPGLGKIIELWGFSTDTPPQTPPSQNKIDEWLTHFKSGPGLVLSQIQPSQPTLGLTNSATALDLGGIAKGYAIDRAIEQLRKAGIENGLVNAGGDIRGIGHKGDKPWRVGIQHPRETERVIAVSQWPNRKNGDMALVTSGDYERFFMDQGQRYHHILDPETGYPAKSGLLSVSVQADNALLADGLSTAFFVMGEELTRRRYRESPGVEVLLIRQDESHWKSEGFQGEWLGR